MGGIPMMKIRISGRMILEPGTIPHALWNHHRVNIDTMAIVEMDMADRIAFVKSSKHAQPTRADHAIEELLICVGSFISNW
jgi:hypothetical protein